MLQAQSCVVAYLVQNASEQLDEQAVCRAWIDAMLQASLEQPGLLLAVKAQAAGILKVHRAHGDDLWQLQQAHSQLWLCRPVLRSLACSCDRSSGSLLASQHGMQQLDASLRDQADQATRPV